MPTIDYSEGKIPKVLTDVTRGSIFSIFNTIFGSEPKFHGDGDGKKMGDGVVGIISFMGDINWIVMLELPKESAKAMASKFCGFDIDYDSADMGDVVGELANVLTLRVLAFDKETVFLEADIRVAIRDHVPPPDKTEKPAPWKIKNSKDNRWALVTGASGEIGRAVSKRLAQNGWNLILNYCSDRG
mgnify:CR=1 FL=1